MSPCQREPATRIGTATNRWRTRTPTIRTHIIGTSTKTSSNRPGSDIPFFSIFSIFLKLGCTSFGGPIAHIGYFRHEFVEKRKWLDDHSYADLVALCNFLPGAASSQVGIALGISQGGLPGGLAAWLGFTLPSALALIAFAYAVTEFGITADTGWLHGLKIVAVAVVAQAIWGMGKTLCPDRFRATLAIGSTLIVFVWPTAWGQMLAISMGGLAGWRYLKADPLRRPENSRFRVTQRAALVSWVVFWGLLLALPALAYVIKDPALAIFDSFYRSGSLVFGGGHVVLPLLRNEVVPPGWVSDDIFLAGYGAAQAVPGPLFTFAAYLGAVNVLEPNGFAGGTLALVAIFLPSYLIVVGTLPFWEALRQNTHVQSAFLGVNAAVVGLLLAAFYDPVWSSSIRNTGDMALALVAFGLLMYWKVSPLYVVIIAAIGGAAWGAFLQS